MNYFLAKTDPDTYSIDQLETDGSTIWDGIHNYQAINVVKKMQVGDWVYVYHSQSDKAIVGLMEVTDEPFQNTSDTRYSWAVAVRFIKRYSQRVTLSDIKAANECRDFVLIRHTRLSTMEVPTEVQKWLESKLQ
jgi:predicted RNA-binding protein with PUA-like domain